MENSPWLDPRFLFGVGVVAIGFIVWLLRGEFKSNANEMRQKEYEESMDERVGKVEAVVDRVKASFYEHKGDTAVHHNAEAFKEFREGLSQRFATVDTKLAEIKSLIIANHKDR